MRRCDGLQGRFKKREESLIEPERGDFIFLAISNSIGEGDVKEQEEEVNDPDKIHYMPHYIPPEHALTN